MKKVQLELTEQQIRLFHALAQEIVQGYLSKENILKALSISEETYDLISQNPTFHRILQHAMTEWSGATNTAKRVRLKSQWAVEEGIPYIFQSMTDINEPLSARVEAFKAISKIGQLDNQETSRADKTFKLEINIGMGLPPITIDSNISEKVIEHDPNEHEEKSNYSSGRFVPADPPAFGKD